MPYFLNVSLRAEYSNTFFFVRLCQKIALPIDNLHVAVCSFGQYAMNLEPRYLHCSRGQNVSNNKDNMIINYLLLLLCKNVKVCLMKMGELILITMWHFLLGLITDLYMNILTLCWFNRMKQD